VPAVVTRATAFLVDFLPIIRRTLTRTGFVIDHIHYYADALKPWIARRDRLPAFLIRRDPRDISRIWVLEPEGQHYLEIPYRTLSHPAVTLWEQRQALAKLRQQGREQVDESALFRMIGQMREIVTTAQKATRKARRDADRRQHLKTTAACQTRHRRTRTWLTRRQTTSRRPNRSTRLRSGSRGRISHHRPVPPAAGGQGLARLPADERIHRLRADRWIGYPRAVEALNRLETLYAWPNKQRMPNLLLVGPTNNGKSMIVEKFRRTHPASSDADQEHIPVLVVQMPSEPSVIRFYVALLAAMGAPLRPRPRLPEMEQLALALLRKVGVRMLVIDELHNVLAGNSVNRREFLNLLRFLGNELRIPLVGVGTRDAYLAIRSDDQLENRFEPMMLPVWEANDDCCSLLASFAASLPLRRPSSIATLDMARYLLTRSEGTIGELAHLLMAAAVAAVESGEEAINHRTLSMADYTGPSERRRQFERELM
jgi:hypothetical protein